MRRLQSSSKKNLDLNELKPVIPKMKTANVQPTKGKADLKNPTARSVQDKSYIQGQKMDVKPKKGFSSLPKVASTYNFNPKELLLDSFFNGYRPMTLPISPPPKKTAPRLPANLAKQGGAFVYFEIDDNLDFIDDLKDGMDSNMNRTIEDIERQTSTRFDHSHKSLKEEDAKKEEYERELYETKLEAAKEEDLTSNPNPSTLVERKRFRGRRKLEYKKKDESGN